MENNKYTKGQEVFVLSTFEVLNANYVSRSSSYNYVELKDGVVQGFLDKQLFELENDALKELVKVLKENIYYKAKVLTEKIELPTVDKLKELIEIIEKVGKKIKE